ncbi:hypothetical protein GCM10012275_41810 [Longimycelium tulufanense]|uniref:Uncharacterized protein n=2 Tax=Longimycelium tulufanense TaxID=907463 RepID=A0A8J3FXC2_9PSEU|nr:hypothetical protein GCM10012275_41810 [Longimycelium tulufanense]
MRPVQDTRRPPSRAERYDGVTRWVWPPVWLVLAWTTFSMIDGEWWQQVLVYTLLVTPVLVLDQIIRRQLRQRDESR